MKSVKSARDTLQFTYKLRHTSGTYARQFCFQCICLEMLSDTNIGLNLQTKYFLGYCQEDKKTQGTFSCKERQRAALCETTRKKMPVQYIVHFVSRQDPVGYSACLIPGRQTE